MIEIVHDFANPKLFQIIPYKFPGPQTTSAKIPAEPWHELHFHLKKLCVYQSMKVFFDFYEHDIYTSYCPSNRKPESVIIYWILCWCGVTQPGSLDLRQLVHGKKNRNSLESLACLELLQKIRTPECKQGACKKPIFVLRKHNFGKTPEYYLMRRLLVFIYTQCLTPVSGRIKLLPKCAAIWSWKQSKKEPSRKLNTTKWLLILHGCAWK